MLNIDGKLQKGNFFPWKCGQELITPMGEIRKWQSLRANLVVFWSLPCKPCHFLITPMGRPWETRQKMHWYCMLIYSTNQNRGKLSYLAPLNLTNKQSYIKGGPPVTVSGLSGIYRSRPRVLEGPRRVPIGLVTLRSWEKKASENFQVKNIRLCLI